MTIKIVMNRNGSVSLGRIAISVYTHKESTRSGGGAGEETKVPFFQNTIRSQTVSTHTNVHSNTHTHTPTHTHILRLRQEAQTHTKQTRSIEADKAETMWREK